MKIQLRNCTNPSTNGLHNVVAYYGGLLVKFGDLADEFGAQGANGGVFRLEKDLNRRQNTTLQQHFQKVFLFRLLQVLRVDKKF